MVWYVGVETVNEVYRGVVVTSLPSYVLLVIYNMESRLCVYLAHSWSCWLGVEVTFFVVCPLSNMSILKS